MGRSGWWVGWAELEISLVCDYKLADKFAAACLFVVLQSMYTPKLTLVTPFEDLRCSLSLESNPY